MTDANSPRRAGPPDPQVGIEGRLAKIEQNVAALQKDVSVLKDDVGSLKADVATLKGDVLVIKTQLPTFATKEDLYKALQEQTWRMIGAGTLLVAATFWIARNVS